MQFETDFITRSDAQKHFTGFAPVNSFSTLWRYPL